MSIRYHKKEIPAAFKRRQVAQDLILQYTALMITRCFAMCKPGVLNRRLVGQVITRLENKGLRLVGLKMTQIAPELAERHYAEHQGKCFYSELVSYITSGPVIAMVWEGDNCVELVRKLVGATNPLEAAPGTIRGDFCSHMNHNIIHASDSDASAEREIGLFFKPEELINWKDEAALWY
jgi:nucleoside-diphosphate kinase